MYKTGFRILPFLLISAILLPLLLSACSPESPGQTTPEATTVETTAATEPPMTAGPYPDDASRKIYDAFFRDHFDPEIRNFVYALIDNTQWPESQGNMPKLEEFYDEYLVFESHGKKILPYILSYIEERQTQDRFITARLLIIANKMLGHDSIRTSYDGSPLSSAQDWHSFNGWARLLWIEVFTP